MEILSREFQVFAKPVGAACNLDCGYCYYLKNARIYQGQESVRMTDEVLEIYIRQHIEASPGEDVFFSWHGGEPLLAGIDFYRKAVTFQQKYEVPHLRLINGIQTNGTLLNEEWCRFLSENGFIVGVSIDGPPLLHDRYRKTKNRQSTHKQAISGYNLLLRWRIPCETLCVVTRSNVIYPAEVYRFFKEIGAKFITFLPLVEPGKNGGTSDQTVPAEQFGDFLCAIFDEWLANDIGKIKIQIFEEAIRVAFGQEHTLCIFKPTCGRVPVIEHNGDFYACDHYADANHFAGNISEKSLTEMLDSPEQIKFGLHKLASLPAYCLNCNVREMCNGECPKNRFITTPDGEPGLNYLCEGYKKFFNHCRPFVEEVARLWSREQGKGLGQAPMAIRGGFDSTET